MYNPNFNTELSWPKVLELMNELLEYKTESSGSCGEIEYIIVELNDRTKNILCNLGIKFNEVEDEFYDLEEKWLDITSCVWGNIQFHYGHDLYYTGKKFVVLDKEKDELLEALKSANTFIDNGIEYGYIIEPEEPDQACETIKLIKKVIANAEGDKNV